MRRPKRDYVPNQGCGIFYLMVLFVFLLISIPIVTFTYQFVKYFFEEQILFTSDSPDGTYHIEISSEGPSTRIVISEETTSSELIADIIKGGLADVKPGDIEIEWLSDTVAEIIVEGREDTYDYFLFDADAKQEKIRKIFNSVSINTFSLFAIFFK